MDIIDLIANDNFIIINKTIAKELGLETAVLFGTLCSYQRAYKGVEFYREQEKIVADTCLTEYSVRKSLQILKDHNLITIEKKGMPSKNYYRVNETAVVRIQRTSGIEIDTTRGIENNTTINKSELIKENNNIIENTKESAIKKLFEEFWEVYPRKVDKKGSYKAFKNIDHIEQVAPDIIAHVKNKKASKQWQDSQYIPHPTTYLHQERWLEKTDETSLDDWYDGYWDDVKKRNDEYIRQAIEKYERKEKEENEQIK